MLRHTVASELRRLGVPEWDVKGVLGHTGSGVTDGYAKFDGERVRDVLDAWMIDLSRDVPALRKLCPKPLPPRRGLSPQENENGATRESCAVSTT